jgi:hypothetical protein
VLAELLLQDRSGGAGLDPCRERDGIDLEHAVERLEVDRHHARVLLAPGGLDAPDHACAAAERDHRRADRQRPFEGQREFVLVARVNDDVGRMVEASPERAHHVAVRAAIAMQRALVVIGGADVP